MSFEDEMRRFEAEVNRGRFGMGAPAVPPPHQYSNFRPVESLIQGQIHARAGLPPPNHSHHQQMQHFAPPQRVAAPPPGPTTYSALPQTTAPTTDADAAEPSKPAAAAATKTEEDDDEDIFAKLAKYEEDHKSGKPAKEKKKKKKKDKEAGGFVPSAVKAAATAKTTAAAAAAAVAAAAAEKPRTANVPGHLNQPTKPFANSLASASSLIAKSGAPEPATPGTAGAGASDTIAESSLKKAKKMKRVVRTGGGQMWEDNSLKEWDVNDYRIFCGDLGNDVTDEVLQRTFGKYASFQKAKVVRDKKNNKTKGYGFVSFRDPMDFTRAMREINGKYVGSRPIKMRKSNWKDRNVEQVRQKQKIKQQMGYKF